MQLARLKFLIPIGTFLLLTFFLMGRLVLINKGNTPDMIPSVMIGRQVPSFSLPSLMDAKEQISSADFKGRVTLINVFASWCVACRAEHASLPMLKRENLILIGLDYKDSADAATQWLEKMGNPYDKIVSDVDGRVSIDFGVYGVPETYLVDKNGIIRYKHTGPLTTNDIQNSILPLVEELNK